MKKGWKSNVAIAWAAGLFEGEGSISVEHNKIRVTIEMTDRDVLEKIQEIFGGSLYDLKIRAPHYKPSYKWMLTSSHTAAEFLDYVMPYLFARRKNRAEEALTLYKSLEKKKIERAVKLNKKANRILDLKKSGMSDKAIAAELGLERSTITKFRSKYLHMHFE